MNYHFFQKKGDYFVLNAKVIMMKSFYNGLRRYHKTLGKQERWIQRFIRNKGYQANRNWMFRTNLKLWLSEAEDTFGRRICPCFSPTGDQERDRAMLCPCKYLEEDIREKGTCHCTLFAAKDAKPSTFQTAMGRLMKEYQTPLFYNENGEIDIRRYPIDSVRGLRVPDAYHIVKRAVLMAKLPIHMSLEYHYEVEAVRSWANLSGYQVEEFVRDNDILVIVSKEK